MLCNNFLDEISSYNHKSDMWSAGCVLYELCCLRVPFQAPNLPLLVLKILEGCYDAIPSHHGAVLEDLVAVLLNTDPVRRPSAEQVLNVPALQLQVKSTYRRCIGHKQQRHQRRLLSVEMASPSGPDKGDAVLPGCQTYTVRSPLLRRLSVATPKLKAAVKRPRCVQSAEAVCVAKRQRKSSRSPVLNLQEAVLRLSPSSAESLSDSEHPCVKMDAGDEALLAEAANISDVFEEETPRKAERNELDGAAGRDDIFMKVKSPAAYDPSKTGQSVKVSVHSRNAQPRSKHSSVHSKQRSHSERDHARTKIDPSPPSKSSVSKLKTYTVSKKQSVSDGATSPKQDRHCSACRDQGSQSQQCLHQALYTAAALSYRNTSDAKRSLSRFLIAHLGSELSLHLCSVVNSAMRAGREYSSVEKSLDDSCKVYLPAIFQLLILSGNPD